MQPLTKVIVAGVIVVGVAALIGAPREASTPRPAPVASTETTFSGAPLTREQCGILFREMHDAATAGAGDPMGDDPAKWAAKLAANDARFYAKRAQYNEQCGALCTPGGCQ